MSKNCGTYLMFERIRLVQELIQGGYYPSLKRLQESIKERLGTSVSISTLTRDLDFLRTRANCPIEYQPQMGGYYVRNQDAF